MRLTIDQKSAIQQAIHSADPEAIVFLFGSRVDDDSKGGDIDLLVLSTKIDLMKKLDILVELHQKLGERKIDLVVFENADRPFAQLAIKSGIRL